jgi:hypothetical protein
MNYLNLCIFLMAWGTSFLANAFTLVTEYPHTKFGSGKIVVHASNNNCSNAGKTPSELLDLVEKSADKFWNRVATSSLKIKKGVIKSVDFSSDDGAAAIAKVEYGTIYIGCTTNISDPAWTGGVGSIMEDAGGVKGVILINNNASTPVGGFSEDTLLSLIAHEMGHTLGISHSDDTVALMYYTLSGKEQKALAQDDRDAATYLYPAGKELMGLGGSCATIEDQRSSGGTGPFTASLIVGLMLALLGGWFLSGKFRQTQA